MPTSIEAIAAYEKVWNERDRAKRAQLLEECTTSDLRYIGPEVECQGRNVFNEYLASLEESALSRKYSPAADHHGHVWLSWKMPTDDGSMIRHGAEFGEFSPDGRLKGIVAFESHNEKKMEFGKSVYYWAMENPLPAAAALGAVLYLILRVPLSLFYGKFGVTPEEVGFDNVTVLLRSALAIGGVFVMVCYLVLLAFPASSALMVASQLDKQFNRPKSLSSSVVAIFGPIVLYSMIISIHSGRYRTIQEIVASFAVFVLWPPLYLSINYRGPMASARRQALKDLIRGLSESAAVNLLLFELVLVLLVGPIVAITDANNLSKGSQISDLFRPWKAPAIEVSWTTDEKKRNAPTLPTCGELRLLGSTDKQIVLLNWSTRDVYRFPPNDVVVTVKKDCQKSTSP